MSASIAIDEKKVKKSVALSGITAGNTAICKVGDSLTYRGFDIIELAQNSTF